MRSNPVDASSDSGATTDSSQEARQKELILVSQGGSTRRFVKAFLKEGDTLEANKMFADLLLNLTAENAKEAFDALQESGRGARSIGREMGLFLQAWGRLDGESAIAAVEELGGDGRMRVFGSMSAVEGWASVDPESAKAYVNGLEDGKEKGMMSQGLISGLAQNDPDAATEYVLALETERGASDQDAGADRFRTFATDRQMGVIAEAQLRKGVGVATAWAENLPDGDLKAAAFDQVAEAFVRSDPAAAAEWVKQHAGEEYAQRAVREIAEDFGRTDPKAAIEWASTLPEESQQSALSETLRQWTQSDPTQASEYLQGMASSPTRDAAIGSFARQLDREDPASAAIWAAEISNEQSRTATLTEVGQSWMRTDSAGAKEWLPTSGLSEEAQQKIINQPQGDRRGGFGGPGSGGRPRR